MSINPSALHLLDQLKIIIRQLDESSFSRPIATLSNSSIGQHVRHTLEFFTCLIASADTKVVNYDKRKHDKFIESNPMLALGVLDDICAFLASHQEDFSLDLEANYTTDSTAFVRIPSCYARELAYNIEHAVHHMALIKIGLRDAFPEVKLPDHFGVASSTVRFQKQQTARV